MSDPCGATMTSRAQPEHRHECRLSAPHNDHTGHVCGECGLWFWPGRKAA